MTRFTPLWLQAGSYAASVDRRLLGALYPDPRSSGCALSAPGAMNVAVAPGTVAVPLAGGVGSVLCVSDGVETVTLTAAPASGVNRIDLVVCQARGADIDGGGNNDFIFAAVAGAPAAAPVPPAVPANAAALGSVYLVGGSAAVDPALITPAHPGSLAVGAGTPPGAIIMGGWAVAPAGYLMCNGAAVSRATYAALFAAIGASFGAGDGASTFNVPNFVGKFPTHGTAGVVSPGTTHNHPLSGAAWANIGIGASAPPALNNTRRESIPSYQDLGLSAASGIAGTAFTRGTSLGGAVDVAAAQLPPYLSTMFVIKT